MALPSSPLAMTLMGVSTHVPLDLPSSVLLVATLMDVSTHVPLDSDAAESYKHRNGA